MADDLGLPEQGEVPAWHGALEELTANLVREWKNQEWTWTSGGCFAFAEVFAGTFGGEEYGICSFEDDEHGGDYPVEHAVVKLGDAFYDYKGRLNIEAEMTALSELTGRKMYLKPRSDPKVFWFEDDFLDDDDFDVLRRALAACVPEKSGGLRP